LGYSFPGHRRKFGTSNFNFL